MKERTDDVAGLKSNGKINLMFSCVGRRVSLIRAFARSARSLGLSPTLVGTDKTELSPALQLCEHRYITPPIKDGGYLRMLLDVVKKHRIHLLVPTIDLELKLLATHREDFERLGCRVLVSAPGVVDICQDKRKTFRFLVKHGLPCPETMTLEEALDRRGLKYPRFLKPWDGYASRGNAVVNNREELRVLGARIPNCIVQEFIAGREFTCDVYADFENRVRCVVPRQRLEVRTGEVSKGRTVKDAAIMEHTREVVERLGAGPGVITVQLIVNGEGRPAFIEINPRFGGGAPLSIKAGANFPRWILQEMLGQTPRIRFDGFRDGLTMLRYDAEVWMRE